VKSKFGDTPLLVVDSTLGWSGKVSHHVSVPKYEANEPGLGKMTWKGIEGDIDLTDHGNRIQARVDLPGFSINEEKNNIQIDNIVLKGEQSRTQQYRSIWVGSSVMDINKIAVNIDNSPPFALDNLKLASDAVLKGEIFDVSVSLSAAKLQMQGETVEQIGLTYGVENLDAATFDKLIRVLETLSPNSDEQAILSSLLEQAPALLERKPAFVLRDVKAKFAEGDAKGNLRVAYVGAGKVEEFNPLTDLAGELNFSLPRAFAARLLTEKLRNSVEEVEDEDEDEDDEGKDDVDPDALITALVDIGLIEDNKGTLSIAASFKDGAFGLNGKTLTVAEAMELLQSVPN
jgi:uncharacterized protein YdgA (DUF945 family)